jgi:molecular chaperone HscB
VASPSSSEPAGVAQGHADPFALLGLAPGFAVDLAALERAYYERAVQLHPDRMTGASAAERVAQLSRARALNDAYQLIKRPIARAEHLLARAGLAIGDRERLEPAFLMEILELREELAGVRAAGDQARVAALAAAMAARRAGALAALADHFAAGDLAAAKQQVIALRYLQRYLDECDAAQGDE